MKKIIYFVVLMFILQGCNNIQPSADGFDPYNKVKVISKGKVFNLPVASNYVLVNGDEWGMPESVANRRAIPFTESDGSYCGPPMDDEAAINEFTRVCIAFEPTHLVIWWTCFWWLDYYIQFRDYLNTNFPPVLDNDCLKIFDLRKPFSSISVLKTK